MELIDKSKIDFTTIEPYEYSNETMKIAFKEDIEELPIVKAISIDRLKEARKEIDDLWRYYDNDFYTDNIDPMFKCEEVLEIIDKLIESEDKQWIKNQQSRY